MTLSDPQLGLPTLDLGIPGRPPLSSRPFPSPPLPSLLSLPLPPSRSPWAPPLNQLGGLPVWGSDVSSPSGSGTAPANKGFGAYIQWRRQLVGTWARAPPGV